MTKRWSSRRRRERTSVVAWAVTGIEAGCGVFTNTAPIDAYRGAGKPEANYLIERLVDEAAYRLRIDPTVLRKRNFIRRFPYRKPFGAVLDSGDYSNNLDCVLTTADRAASGAAAPSRAGVASCAASA